MILKRLAGSISRQDWFSVCLEILIVVVGIYLGLQASEWSQNRDDRQAEIAYLERIVVDLRSSETQTRKDANFQSRHAVYGGLIVDSLDACELSPGNRDEFASGIYLAGKYINATFVKATIEELLSSGRTTLIRNAELRQKIIELLRFYDEHLFYMSDVQLRTVPHINYIDSVVPVTIRGAIGGGANITWDRLRTSFEDMCKDKRLLSAVIVTTNYTWDSTHSLYKWADQLSGLGSEVETELRALLK
ncbi:hypothetical protein R0135_02430 [Congregibacter variabilis]|uniref:Uncharacterized protein n=1 Tax=Congregibacter variabilis TaxID=3081200 RepID=A0ABZ0I4R1_9GAMM|nr:hypothetical protein R0135_02430 [Congregibacter sp. IMCC43200]